MNIHTPPLRDSLAAEYVLGTLHGAARRRFERLLAAHPALQRAITEWERRLNRLTVASPPVPPPPEVWRNLERRLFPAAPRRPWWDSLALWRGLALAGVLAAVITLAPQLAPPPAAEISFAAIRGQRQEVLWTVALADDGRLHVSNLRAMTVPPNERCLLWLKTGDGPPVMLGVLPDDGGARTLPMPAGLARPAREGELWVTMQPVAPDPAPPTQPLYQTRWQAI
jgi:anti-sigma-K factor RskA